MSPIITIVSQLHTPHYHSIFLREILFFWRIEKRDIIVYTETIGLKERYSSIDKRRFLMEENKMEKEQASLDKERASEIQYIQEKIKERPVNKKN